MLSSRLGLAKISLILLAGCPSTLSARYATCRLSPELLPTEAVAGAEVELIGGPLTTRDDTLVRVGGVQAEIISIARPNCPPCDSCREDNDCGGCSTCVTCEESCASCQEITTIKIPDLPAGSSSIIIYNAYGASDALPFHVLAQGTIHESGL